MKGIFFNGKAEDGFLGHIFAEIYKDKVYAPFLEGKKDLVIVDIGANVGIATFYFQQFAKKVVSVEPAAEHFAALSQMVKYNEFTNVVPVKAALFLEDKEFPLFHNPNRTMYSLHAAVSNGEIEKVRGITFETLLKENHLEEIDFMKLDVEGSEAEIICSKAFQEHGHKVKVLILEVHAWGQRNQNQLKEALEAVGFTKIEQMKSDATIIVCTR